jgi:hypothetical protein
MWTFIIAGALYLIGVGVVLVLRPAFMFTPDGNWKEFGIGQREDRYTPFPFWLFCLTWAILSYVIVLLLRPLFESPTEDIPMNTTPKPNNRSNNRRNNRRKVIEEPELEPEPELEMDAEAEEAVELPKGYYVLNKKATKLSGVPKYVYLGPEEPAAN